MDLKLLHDHSSVTKRIGSISKTAHGELNQIIFYEDKSFFATKLICRAENMNYTSKVSCTRSYEIR